MKKYLSAMLDVIIIDKVDCLGYMMWIPSASQGKLLN